MKNPQPHRVPHGESTVMQLLPRSNQEYLCHIQENYPEVPVVLPGHGPESGDKKLLLRRIHWRHGNPGYVVEGEGTGLVRGGADVIRGCTLASSGVLLTHAEVPPTGVGLCAAHQPGGRGGIPPGGGCPTEGLRTDPIPQGGETHFSMGCHPTSYQSDWVGTARPNPVLPGVLYGVLYCYSPLVGCFPGTYIVLVW